ncbi:DUF3467 domain-containing protein [uncultured Bacteroides sp.]|uniref:DUF3467 domain-containing protein n=1 Tax=uncultured Bacteroides sp. TaxID=162156 RepID=UPI002AA7DAA1|nr:DUF3467 domain-containing protein [uncultured Bacteroides sp.]
MNDQKNEDQIQIELDEEVAQGKYANLAIIAHSSSEFLVDFICVMPGTPKAKVLSRLILAPEHAKRLLKALNDNIEKYERLYGSIRLVEEQELPAIMKVKGEA